MTFSLSRVENVLLCAGCCIVFCRLAQMWENIENYSVSMDPALGGRKTNHDNRKLFIAFFPQPTMRGGRITINIVRDGGKKLKIKSIMVLKRQFNEFSCNHCVRLSSNHYFLWPELFL